MIEELRKGGGRGYALGAFAIGAVTALAVLYMAMLAVGLWQGKPLTPELLSPLTIIVLTLGGLGGATQLPNVAERWAGKQVPPPAGDK